MALTQITSSPEALEALRSTPLPGEEFPYANAGLGLKCCSKCGATKTPQWREGPCGPKTLCNACGVKRTRTLRALQEGSKRARVSPGSSRARAEASTAAGSTESGGGSSGVAGSPPPLFVGSASRGGTPARRPQRRAAEEAALRTARYARTGEWAEAGGVPSGTGAGAAIPRRFASPPRPAGVGGGPATPSSSQDTALGPGSWPDLGGEDGEVAWTPLASAAAARHGLGPAAMDPACYAAVNLMTLAARRAAAAEACSAGAAAAAARGEDDGDADHARHAARNAVLAAGTPTNSSGGSGEGKVGMSRASPGATPGPPAIASPLPMQRAARPLASLPDRGAREAGVQAAPALPALPALTGMDLPELYKSLPPAQVMELIRLNADLERALSSARAASSSLAALAQLLAEKQAASLAARAAARAASRRMHRFLAALGGDGRRGGEHAGRGH